MKMLCDHKGNRSSMRAGFLACLCVGAIVSLSGVVAMFYSIPDAGVAITTGTALMGGSGFSKAIQKRYETHDDK